MRLGSLAAVALAAALLPGCAEAACTGSTGVPFNCAAGTTPNLSDDVLAGSNSGAQSGQTVKYTLSQIIALALATANTWTATQTFGSLVLSGGWTGEVAVSGFVFDGSLAFDGGSTGGIVGNAAGASTAGSVMYVSASGSGAGTNLAGGAVEIKGGSATGTGIAPVQIYATGGGSSGTSQKFPVKVVEFDWNLETHLQPVILPIYTVSTLPACISGLQGALAVVSDALSPIYNGALTGGSSTMVPVFCNGSSWTSH
jgi:hypothetical protein